MYRMQIGQSPSPSNAEEFTRQMRNDSQRSQTAVAAPGIETE